MILLAPLVDDFMTVNFYCQNSDLTKHYVEEKVFHDQKTCKYIWAHYLTREDGSTSKKRFVLLVPTTVVEKNKEGFFACVKRIRK